MLWMTSRSVGDAKGVALDSVVGTTANAGDAVATIKINIVKKDRIYFTVHTSVWNTFMSEELSTI